MHVVVVMVAVGAGFAAEGVLGTALIVEHFMKQAHVQERPQCPVYRYAVVVGAEPGFYVVMRQGMTASAQKQVKNLLPASRMPQIKGFQCLCSWSHVSLAVFSRQLRVHLLSDCLLNGLFDCFKLQFNQIRVDAIFVGRQFIMGALLGNLPLTEHIDGIHFPDGSQPVRNDDGGAVLHQHV